MNAWIVIFYLVIVADIPTLTFGIYCNRSRTNLFLDYNVGEDYVEDSTMTSYKFLGTFQQPFLVFDMESSETEVSLNLQGSLMLTAAPDAGVGGLSIVPYHLSISNDWHGRFYYRYTNDIADLMKIDSYMCHFHSESALVFTFSCLTRDFQTFTPEANYQVVVVYGQDNKGTKQTMLFIVYDLVQEQTSSLTYLEFIGMPGRYPLPLNNNTILPINVTTNAGFTDGVNPPMLSTSCPIVPPVRCSLTAEGVLSTFDNQEISIPYQKITLAEWNPGKENCKFKFQAKFQNRYRWTTLAVGPHRNSRKFFRYIEFNRIPGKVTQRGWRCKGFCKGVIRSFNQSIGEYDGSITYATVRELDPDIRYTLESDICSGDLQPDYRLIYDFGAAASEPVAILELAPDFYEAFKNDMSGLCLGGP